MVHSLLPAVAFDLFMDSEREFVFQIILTSFIQCFFGGGSRGGSGKGRKVMLRTGYCFPCLGGFPSLKEIATFRLPLWNLEMMEELTQAGRTSSLRGSTPSPWEKLCLATHSHSACRGGEVFSPTLLPSLQFSSHWLLPQGSWDHFNVQAATAGQTC